MAEPNPGPGAIGAVITDERGNRITSISRGIGYVTNNQAEYQAIIAALEKIISLGIKQAEIRADSELVVRQVNGKYKVKNAALRPLYSRIVELQGQLDSFSIKHIPREQNKEADRLAGQAVRY